MKKYGIFTAVLISVCLLHVNAFATEEKTEAKEHSEHKEMKEEKTQKELTVYQCPMKCEKDIVYTEEGKCPKCGMDFESYTLMGDKKAEKSDPTAVVDSEAKEAEKSDHPTEEHAE